MLLETSPGISSAQPPRTERLPPARKQFLLDKNVHEEGILKRLRWLTRGVLLNSTQDSPRQAARLHALLFSTDNSRLTQISKIVIFLSGTNRPIQSPGYVTAAEIVPRVYACVALRRRANVASSIPAIYGGHVPHIGWRVVRYFFGRCQQLHFRTHLLGNITTASTAVERGCLPSKATTDHLS